jgi:gamma-glutamyltranspeptidase/glutathione hydrolase
MRDTARALVEAQPMKRFWPSLFVLLTALAGLLSAAHGADQPRAGANSLERAHATTFMVAAANPYAADAGLEMLRAGGSAADAALAVQLVLNLVEPQSSGLGGGAFVLSWDRAAHALTSWDGRETAPSAARPARFLVDGKPRPFKEAVFGGLSVGVPGVLRALEALHRRSGRLPWARAFEPALRLAEQGFRVSPRLSQELGEIGAAGFAPAARQYFFDATGSPRPAGYLLRNAEFAATLRALAAEGAAAFYSGTIAETIVTAVRSAPNHAGDMTLADLADYRAQERPPLCFEYRRQRICSMAPPSSGGYAMAQTLELLEPFDLGSAPSAAMNAKALHLIAEAEKLAYADRDRYLADPDFVSIPHGLLDPDYLGRRRALIDPDTAMERASAGKPPDVAAGFGSEPSPEAAGTSHFSIVDGEGNALAVTTTIESAFGSRLWAAGFLLNNELTDFSFRPTDAAGRPVANAVAPGKRPRSSMAPTIVFDEAGEPRAVVGSVGGSRIILYVLKTLVSLIDWKLDAQAATSLMNFGSRGGPFEIEVDHPAAVWHALKVKPFGHRVSADVLNSGTHVVLRRPDGTLEGGADPRREGVAVGQ